MTDDPIVARLPIARLMSLFGRSVVNSSYAGSGVFEEVHRTLLGRVEDLQSVVRVGRRCEWCPFYGGQQQPAQEGQAQQRKKDGSTYAH